MDKIKRVSLTENWLKITSDNVTINIISGNEIHISYTNDNIEPTEQAGYHILNSNNTPFNDSRGTGWSCWARASSGTGIIGVSIYV